MRVPYGRLLSFGRDALAKRGVPAEDAAAAAEALAAGDLHGVETHGIRYVPFFVRWLEKGTVNPRPTFRLDREGPSFAVLNADNALGPVAACRAMGIALEKASAAGLGAVAVRNSNTFVYGAFYAAMALPRKMVGLAMTNWSRPGVRPPEGLDRLLGTNPLAVAVPSRHEAPFLLDMSTSVVSEGRIRMAKARGGRASREWLLDPDGSPTEDPSVVGPPGTGSVRPLGVTAEHGAHKGFGLGILVDILCGVLSGGVYGNYRQRIGLSETEVYTSTHFLGALNPLAFRAEQEYLNDIDTLLSVIRRSRPRPGVDRVRYPGLRAFECARENRERGVPVALDILETLRACARDLGIEPPG